MVQPGDHPRLGQICGGIPGAGDALPVRDLDGNQPLQLLVAGEVNHAEAAPAKEAFNAVAADVPRWVGLRGCHRHCRRVVVCVGCRSVVAHFAPARGR